MPGSLRNSNRASLQTINNISPGVKRESNERRDELVNSDDLRQHWAERLVQRQAAWSIADERLERELAEAREHRALAIAAKTKLPKLPGDVVATREVSKAVEVARLRSDKQHQPTLDKIAMEKQMLSSLQDAGCNPPKGPLSGGVARYQIIRHNERRRFQFKAVDFCDITPAHPTQMRFEAISCVLQCSVKS
eukprot:2736867-Amphidinium_carterae.1